VTKSTFKYEIYIASTPTKVWKALLEGEFTRQYWGHTNVSDWKVGSEWEHHPADEARGVAIVGQVLEATAPHRLIITWADPQHRGDRARHSRVSFLIEPIADMVRLTITHDELESGSDMQRKVSAGWPRVLSSLKSLLETGRALDTWAKPKN
jgi:uncharacterized protein YndB with AHSA1/START domain